LEQVSQVEISLAVDAGVPMSEPSSPSHALEVTRLDERRCHLRLAGSHTPDHDFVLRYEVGKEKILWTAWRTSTKGDDCTYVAS